MYAERSIVPAPSGGSEGLDGRGNDAARREDERLAALARYDILDTPSEETFDRITRITKKFFRVPMVAVSLIDGHRQWFKSRQGVNVCETGRDPAFCNVAIRRDGVLVVNDALADPRFAENPLVTGDPYIRFYAGAPLRTSDGHALGALCVLDTEPRDFSDDDVAMLTDLSQIVMDEIELRQLASTDTLTGSLSRRAFCEEAVRAIHLAARHNHELSLVTLDLDNFKTINDTYGHAVGDAVLARSVAACQAQLRSSDLIGRLGGEEFAVLLPYSGARAALEVAERLRAAIAAEIFRVGPLVLNVSASFGIATRSRDLPDIDLILREADAALYIAKAQGRNRCVVARPAEIAGDAVDRRRVFKGGRILFDRRNRSRDCTVRALSHRGAGIDVSSSSGLPDMFELAIDADETVRHCRIVSASERRLEVEFV